MAIAISNIPVLKGKEAEDFIMKAQEAEVERGSIDFSQQRNTMQKILELAELWLYEFFVGEWYLHNVEWRYSKRGEGF